MTRAPRGERRLEGRCRDLAHGGDGVVTTGEGVYFVRGAYPDEDVEIGVTAEAHGRKRTGRLLRVVTPRGDWRVPPCVVVEACGGCPWMALPLEVQREQKRAWVERATGLVPTFVVRGPAEGYRRRARLHVAVDRQGRRVGYRPAGGSGVVDVAACVVLEPALQEGLVRFRERILPLLTAGGEVHLGVAHSGRPMVSLHLEGNASPAVYAAFEGLVNEGHLAGAGLAVGPAQASWGVLEEDVSVAGVDLRGPFPGFSQANAAVNGALVESVLELAAADGREVLELYAGSGNFTVPLAMRAARVRAVESDARAVEALRANLARLGLGNVSVVHGAAEHHVDGASEVLVLDPPRTGAKGVVEAMGRYRPARIVYVSCDVVTLARDLGALFHAGYTPTKALAFDMFPETAHVESVVLAERGPRS